MSLLGDILGKILGAAKAVASAAGGSATAAPSVDVDAVLTKAAAAKTEKLDWKNSIVDLMKVLDMDSSIAARKQLAKELKYDGDTNDSAKMNVWLHKQVVQKLVENGGKVPDSMKH